MFIMITKNVHTIVFSPCGGTENVAKAIVKDIGLPKFKYNVTLPEGRKQKLIFTDSDLIFFVFPVYGGHIPINSAEVFSKFKGNNTPAVLVAVYGNRAYEGALLDLNKLALAKGFKPFAASAAVAEHSMAPAFATNRPDAADIDVLSRFGTEVIERLQEGIGDFEPPGFYPSWPMPPDDALLIRADENCTSCGICVKVCPAGAITQERLQESNAELCITCGACFKYCPIKARDFVSQAFRKMGAEHLKDAVERKEAEFFF